MGFGLAIIQNRSHVAAFMSHMRWVERATMKPKSVLISHGLPVALEARHLGSAFHVPEQALRRFLDLLWNFEPS